MDKTIEYVVAYIATLKAGCAYIPIELVHPVELLNQLLEEGKPVLVLSKSEFVDRLPQEYVDSGRVFVMNDDEDGVSWLDRLERWRAQCVQESQWKDIEVHVEPHNLAYLVFSSGTTGKPKAITCPHRGAVNSYLWRFKAFPFDENDREGCNIFFVWELLRPLLRGAILVIIPDDVIYAPRQLVEFMSRNRVNRILFTPSLLQAILDMHTPEEIHTALSPHLKIVWMCGEVVTMKLFQRFQQALPKSQLLNLYSVSECHDVTGADIAELQSDTDYASTGFMIDNVQIYILDEEMQLVEKGQVGELYVGGVALAREYLDNPELTSERFVPNPFLDKPLFGDDNRLYRTGDLARILPDNSLEIRGRCNSMVKIRGYSVELCAIEAHLQSHSSVEAAIVLTEGEDLLTKRLVAYVIAKDSEQLNGQELRDHLRQHLPHYMIPQVFMQISEFPLHPASGKVQKTKLPLPRDHPECVLQLSNFVQASTDTQKTLLTSWQEIFPEVEANGQMIGIHDSFFDLGGNSFQMARLYGLIERSFPHASTVLSLPQMYSHPTIAEMSAILDKSLTDSAQFDLYNEVEEYLTSDIVAKNPVQLSSALWQNIFLTGVTGFLGAFLLRDCLELHPESTVHCLVRSGTDKEGMERIVHHMSSFRLWKEEYRGRINAIVGNLELEDFGITSSVYRKLVDVVDVIVHNGAIVDFNMSYQQLKSTNVNGSRNVLLFASSSHASSTKPILYVSTSGVFPLESAGKSRVIEEMYIPNQPEHLKMGYSQSKWVAERMMVAAMRDRGFHVAIFRPGDITGDSIHGRSNPNHDFVRLLQGVVKMQSAPQDRRMIDMTPVDFVSSAIISHQIGVDDSKDHFIFNLVHPEPVRFDDIVHLLRTQIGYRVNQISSDAWLEKLRQDSDTSNPVVPLWPTLQTIMNHGDMTFSSSKFKQGTLPRWTTLLPIMIQRLIRENMLPQPTLNRLFGKVAVVTGGSSGIGRAICEALVSHGVNVVLGARRMDRLEAVKQSVEEQHNLGRVAIHKTDVVIRQEVKDLVRFAEETFGPVDIFINNAGIMPITLMKNCKEDVWDQCIDVNIKGVLNGIGAALPGMLERKRGDIVTISSNAGREVWDALAVYSGTKFAVEAICKGLRREIHGSGVRVIQLQPGDVKTDLLLHSQEDKEAFDQLMPQLAERMLDPEDVAASVVHALSQPEHVAINEILIEPHA